MNEDELRLAIELLETSLLVLKRQFADYKSAAQEPAIPPDSEVDFFDERTSEWARL